MPDDGGSERATASPHGPSGHVRILVLERLPVVRHGTRLLLDHQPDLAVVAASATVAEAAATERDPDVVVHGLLLADGWGPEVARQLHARFPRSALVVLTILEHPLYVHLAMRAGARGYVTKSSPPELLVEAVRRTAGGERYVVPGLGAELATWEPSRTRSSSWSTLTAREREVLELLALGHTNKEVASALGTSLRTVETHRYRVFQKLGMKRRSDVVRFATSYTQRSLGSPQPGPPAAPGHVPHAGAPPWPAVAEGA